MTKDSTLGMSTRWIHAGDQLDDRGGIHTPLDNHSTFAFPNTQGVLDVVGGRSTGNLYTRYGLNPTILSVEETAGGWDIESVDGGQTVIDKRGVGQQGIKAKTRTWRRRGSTIDDTPPGERSREGACVIDTEKLLGEQRGDDTEPTPYIPGVGGSQYQDPAAIDWSVLARTHRFVIARATYGLKPDRTFVDHVARARAAGLQVGGYHFLWQDVGADAQLAAFRAQLDAAGIGAGDILPAVDLEDDGPRDFAIYEPRARRFIEGMGEMLIYTGPDFYRRMGEPEWLRAYPWWIAHYTEADAPHCPWVDWAIWQHTGTGRVDGFDKQIDRNRARRVPVRSGSGTGYL